MMDKPERVSFRFERDPQYRLVPVNGIWGGPTLRGDIRVEFFYERQTTPESLTQAVTSEGELGEIVERKPDPTSYMRTIMVGMMLTAAQAESIGKFLQEKAQLLRTAEATELPKKDKEDDDGTGTTH